jgi:hypothetical protein
MKEKFAASAEVHDEKQFLFGPKCPVKLDDKRVIYLLKNTSFAKNRFNFILPDNFVGL